MDPATPSGNPPRGRHRCLDSDAVGGMVMAKWQYKIINIRSENYRLDPASAPELDRLGIEGWELVSITSVNFKTGATDNIAMVFKRPTDDS